MPTSPVLSLASCCISLVRSCTWSVVSPWGSSSFNVGALGGEGGGKGEKGGREGGRRAREERGRRGRDGGIKGGEKGGRNGRQCKEGRGECNYDTLHCT